MENTIIQDVKQRFNEDVINESGEEVTEFWINNTFFYHQAQYQITWPVSRGPHSTIDYIISNKEIHSAQILDVRTLTSENVATDHGLVLWKLTLRIKRRKEIRRN